MKLDGEVERRLDAAARAYREGIEAHPEVPEIHLRLGRVLALLDRLDEADRHLAMTMTLRPDPRQAYLTALFLGDLRERQRRPEDAMAAYASALQAWPGAQAPVVALARLRVLTGAADAGRATLAGVHVERDMRERSDPWLGYVRRTGLAPVRRARRPPAHLRAAAMIRLLALGLALAALAPQFRTEANAVRIEALVLDDGRPVPGLDGGRRGRHRQRPAADHPRAPAGA